MTNNTSPSADATAVRTALWRALHLETDASPHIVEDSVGLQLAAPSPDWRDRPDMHPQATSRNRATIVARARFVDDLVSKEAEAGIGQYVILGAGLDSFAQRRPEIGSRLHIFEVDQPSPQAWKQRRLTELGLAIPDRLRFVPVDFEAGASWWERLLAAGFDGSKPAIVASLGVSMYLTRDAIFATLTQIARLAPGSTLAMTFQLPSDLIEPEERPIRQVIEHGARTSGTPFISYFSPEAILALAGKAGLAHSRHVSAATLSETYFTGRTDGLRPSSTEEILVASI